MGKGTQTQASQHASWWGRVEGSPRPPRRAGHLCCLRKPHWLLRGHLRWQLGLHGMEADPRCLGLFPCGRRKGSGKSRVASGAEPPVPCKAWGVVCSSLLGLPSMLSYEVAKQGVCLSSPCAEGLQCRTQELWGTGSRSSSEGEKQAHTKPRIFPISKSVA